MEQQSLEMIFGTYRPYKITEDTTVISFMNGSQYMYLLEGTEKALLLDTGYGAGNLRSFVESLTDKPILVANTHFHPDHAAGNGEFEEIFMSRGASIDAPSVNTPGFIPFDLNRLPYPDYKHIYIGTGDIIELGGRTIEVYDAKPAHCNSSLFFFDRANGMFFCGDELEAGQVNLFDNSANPEVEYDVKVCLDNFRENASFVKSLRGEIQYLLPNHNGTPIAFSYVDDFIGLVDAVYAGTAVIEDKLNHPFIEMDPKASSLCRVRYKSASVFINKSLLMEVYGERISTDYKTITLESVSSGQDIKGIIFDLDGVICFTDRYHYKAWKKIADEEGIEFDEVINERLRGVSRAGSLEIILEKAAQSYTQGEKNVLMEKKNDAYKELLKNMSPGDVAAEVRDTLQALREKGLKLAIGSSSKNTGFILERIGLNGFFDAVSDGTNITRSKPDPEVFLKAADMIGLKPEECLVVEDAEAGIDAAVCGGFHNAGIGSAKKYIKTENPLSDFQDLLKLV